AAAGEMDDPEGVHSAWTNLVAERIEKGAALELVDWQNLLNAVRRINDPDYLQQQLINFQHIASPHILDQMSTALQAQNFSRKLNPDKNDSERDLITKEKTMRILELLKRDVEYLSNNAQLNRNFYTEPMSLSLLNRSSVYTNVPEEYIRTVYDEMTTDSSTTLNIFPSPTSEPSTNIEADAEAGETPAMGPTGYPLDELRYQNWKTINELLFDAKLHDKKYMDAVDEAIKLGTPPPSRDTEWDSVPELDEFVGLCDSATTQSDKRSTPADGEKTVTLDEFREKIFELRGRKA
ncbi:hypothetical protein KCU89_g14809, partial [Aureobasidium melanogenum]